MPSPTSPTTTTELTDLLPVRVLPIAKFSDPSIPVPSFPPHENWAYGDKS